MSHDNNTTILDTASELIDRLEGTKMAQNLIDAVERNDLQAVYELNHAILQATAQHVALETEIY